VLSVGALKFHTSCNTQRFFCLDIVTLALFENNTAMQTLWGITYDCNII